jgi:glycosyltransferase involved in cell wall biosynthesis
MITINSVPPNKLQALQLVSRAIYEARAGRFDAFDATLEQLEQTIQYLEPSDATEQRQVLEKLKVRYARTHKATSDPDSPLQNGPFVIVVTPALNGARFINETISSVVAQRGAFALRYHVQDGGSTDGTLDLLKAWEIRLRRRNPIGGAPVRFTWSSQKDRGMYDAIARGFEFACEDVQMDAAHNTLMAWLNSDDVLPVNGIWTACCFMTEHPEFNWITGMAGFMNEVGAVVRVSHEPLGFSQLDLATGRHDGRRLAFVQQEGSFWRRSLWQKAGGLSRDMKLAGDWDLWRRFASITPLVKIQTVLGIHRRHPGQLSSDISGYQAEMDAVTCEFNDKAHVNPHGLSAQYDPNTHRWNAIEVVIDAPRSRDETEVAPPSSFNGADLPLADAPPSIPVVTRSPSQVRKLPESVQRATPDRSIAPVPSELPGGRLWPKISVVTPSYNQGRYIGETIESVIAQEYPNLEYIVVDGGSTDETSEVLRRYRADLTHVISERDRGQSDALNKGFRLATGEIFCWLNSDDQFAPGALFAVAMAFATNDVDMVSGICEIYQDGQLLHRHMSACADGPLPLNDLLDLDSGWNAGQFFYQPEVFFSRALWERAGAHVREDCYYSMDYELWCRFALEGAKLHVVGKPLAKFRQHAEQKTADPSKFKSELILVRDHFLSSHGLTVPKSNRPPVRWDRTLRVAVINDLGPQYGAGIAQARLSAGIEMAGHDVEWFDLASRTQSDESLSAEALIQEIAAYQPDAVLFGNIHARSRESVTLVAAMSASFPTFWVLHDFWLFTGRCAYTGACEAYLRGCDESCPTPSEYPNLAPDRIGYAWQHKRQLLCGPHPPIILANSAWSRKFAGDVLQNLGVSRENHLAQIRLGAPVHLFRPQPRDQSRLAVGLSPSAFVVAFSASSVSDERKGGQYLLRALRDLQLPDLAILVIGNLETPFEVGDVEIVSLGYVTDTAMVVAALSAADVYVGPSSAETFGQVFIEAALAGIPSIGFNQTGVIDSIADGITGLRVEHSSQALGEAIKLLYDDRALLGRLSGWAPIYAANEFSLEASFHSLFKVWRSLGLVDKWGLPHKVGFVRSSRFIDDSLGSIPVWQPIDGLSSVEGPYPASDISTSFRWCHGRVTSLRVNCREGGPHILRLAYYCNLFDTLMVRVSVDGQAAGALTMSRTTAGVPSIASISFDARPGWNRIDLHPEHVREPSGGETRALSFMLKEIDLSRAAASVAILCEA